MVDFREIVNNLQDWHVYDVILPFILVYAIVFAILEKTKIFKPKDGDSGHVKNVNAVIAFVFGLFVVASIQTVQYIQSFIVNIVLFIIFLLALLILLGFIFGEDYIQLFMEDGKIKKWAAWTIGLVVLIVALCAFLWAIGWLEPILEWFEDIFDTDQDTISTVVFLLLIGGVLFWISRGSGEKKSES